MIQLGGRSCTFSLSLVSHDTGTNIIKKSPNETCNRDWVGKHLSNMYPIRNGLKKGDSLLSLLSALFQTMPLGGFR